TQHIVDRLLDGYGWNGTHHYPPMDLLSLYVDQVGTTDLSKERAARHPTMKMYPTIAEALTLGGSKLAVDGVVIVGEHGRYPRCVCYGGVDSYDFHGLETIQCMVERRHGGETGVEWVQAYRGDKFWEAMHEGVWPRPLMDSALCRSHTLTPARAGFNHIFPTD